MTESVRSNQNSGWRHLIGTLFADGCFLPWWVCFSTQPCNRRDLRLWALRPGGSSALLFRFISLLAKGLNQLSWLTNHLRGGAVPSGHLAILPASVIIPGEHQPWLQTRQTPLAGLILVSRVNDKGTEGLWGEVFAQGHRSVYDRDKGHTLDGVISESFSWPPRYSLVWYLTAVEKAKNEGLCDRKESLMHWLSDWVKIIWEREYSHGLKNHNTTSNGC